MALTLWGSTISYFTGKLEAALPYKGSFNGWTKPARNTF
jgi:hypothetical protein